MQYMILIYGDEKNFALMADKPEAQKQLYAAFTQYGTDMRSAGVLRAGGELKPTLSATTVRVRDGKTVTIDGPFAETKEQLGAQVGSQLFCYKRNSYMCILYEG